MRYLVARLLGVPFSVIVLWCVVGRAGLRPPKPVGRRRSRAARPGGSQ